jgi:transcriptional regulator with XRE-family HTH domain
MHAIIPDPARLQVAVGEVIRALRREKGLGQDALAIEVGLHRTYIGSVERGERNISLANLARLAIALDITLEELFRRTESRMSAERISDARNRAQRKKAQ